MLSISVLHQLFIYLFIYLILVKLFIFLLSIVKDKKTLKRISIFL